MKALRITNPKETDFTDIAVPRPGDEDVLIDVGYVGLCGSDLNIYRGLMPMVDYPRIPGHEMSGTIAEKGANVPDTISVGSRVMISPYTNCGVCPACLTGRTNTCEFNRTFGVQRDGIMTARVAIHYSKVYSSEMLNLRQLALVEPLSVGYHAANRGRVQETDIVLILGCGTIGMGAISACVRKGATVIVVDIDDRKLERALEFGASIAINSQKENVAERIAQITANRGVHVAIEAVGLPQTMNLAVEQTAFAGRVVFIGYTKDQVSFDTKWFVRKELDILGSRNALHVFPAVIQMVEKQPELFERLISNVYPFEQAGKALADWDNDPGAITKILIEMNNKERKKL